MVNPRDIAGNAEEEGTVTVASLAEHRCEVTHTIHDTQYLFV